MKKTVKINEATIKKAVDETLRKVLKEEEQVGHPAVYVGTYGKYNNGSIKGAWVDLTKFKNCKQFYAYCNRLHRDEPSGQRELMFQDYEYIPKIFIGESWIDPRFWDFMNDEEHSYDVKYAVADYVSDADEYFERIEDAYDYPGCQNMTDVAWAVINSYGGVNNLDKSTIEQYFDYDAYGSDLNDNGTFIKYDNGYVELY